MLRPSDGISLTQTSDLISADTDTRETKKKLEYYIRSNTSILITGKTKSAGGASKHSSLKLYTTDYCKIVDMYSAFENCKMKPALNKWLYIRSNAALIKVQRSHSHNHNVQK